MHRGDVFPAVSGWNFLILPPSWAKSRCLVLVEQQRVHKLLTRDTQTLSCSNFFVLSRQACCRMKVMHLTTLRQETKNARAVEKRNTFWSSTSSRVHQRTYGVLMAGNHFRCFWTQFPLWALPKIKREFLHSCTPKKLFLWSKLKNGGW